MKDNREWLSSTRNTSLLQCPFFVAHGDQVIKCEGMIEHTCVKLCFQNREDKSFHQQTYCEKEFKRCELYCSIRHWKWDEDE